MSGDVAETEVPIWARVYLTHAVLQDLADRAGVRLLHVKGPAVAESLRRGPRYSQDVDVLVDPDGVPALVHQLQEHGWRLYSTFEDGSAFEHAANYQHLYWSLVDVHRHWPGVTVPAAEAFEVLWQRHTVQAIAHATCTVPDVPAQLLLLVLHHARSHLVLGPPDAWELADAQVRADTQALAQRLGAEVALAAGLGALEGHENDPQFALWRYWSQPEESRLEEWRARFAAAESRTERLRLLGRMVLVNRLHLAMRLGHEPSSTEVAREFVVRIGRGASGAVALVGGRLGRGRD